MKTWRVYNMVTGHDFGFFDGETAADALDAFARDAGYENFAESCSVGFGSEELVAEEPALYYHAGVDLGGEIRWSDDQTTDREEAEADARLMAEDEDHGGTPVVEYWDAAHGPQPGPDAVAGMYAVPLEDE